MMIDKFVIIFIENGHVNLKTVHQELTCDYYIIL
jgi:hypothetical protein